MSIVVTVKKQGKTVIAADTAMTMGSTLVKPNISVITTKLFATMRLILVLSVGV